MSGSAFFGHWHPWVLSAIPALLVGNYWREILGFGALVVVGAVIYAAATS